MSSIKIYNLHFTYNQKEVFKNINFTLEEGKSLSIIGTNASGKTTLLKIFDLQLEYDGKIYIDDILLKKTNYKKLKEKIKVIFKNTKFVYDNVLEELKSELVGGLNSSEIDKRLKELNTFFNVEKLYKRKISDLSKSEKVLIKILSFALSKPKYLVVDDLIKDMDVRNKILLFNYVNSQDIILINVTTNLEEVMFTDKIICLYNGIIAIDGDTLKVLREEKILKRLGFELPFYYDVSIQLDLYGLINRVCLNKEEMVKELWK